MNAIASREQFKPTRIGENVMVNCKGWVVSLGDEHYRVTRSIKSSNNRRPSSGELELLTDNDKHSATPH